MSDLFSSLLHRHKGTWDVVKPRSRLRFETETTNFAIPFNQLDTDEPGEGNLDSWALDAQIPEHHLSDTNDIHIKTLQIEAQENRPVDQPLPLNIRDEQLDHEPLIQPAPNILPIEKIVEQKTVPHTDTSVRDNDEEAPAGPATASRTTIVERFNTPMARPKQCLDDNLDHKISAMLDRIENLRSVVPAPQKESYAFEQGSSDDKVHVGEVLEEPRRRLRQQTTENDETDRANGPHSNGPMQQETAANHRVPPHDTLLAPPSWFHEILSQSMLPRIRPNGESAPEPVINVTIGRIEVKAAKMQETSRVRQPQKPSGIMSLEKYLRQSERGGRQ